jgi:hypothetical protein
MQYEIDYASLHQITSEREAGGGEGLMGSSCAAGLGQQ